MYGGVTMNAVKFTLSGGPALYDFVTELTGQPTADIKSFGCIINAVGDVPAQDGKFSLKSDKVPANTVIEVPPESRRETNTPEGHVIVFEGFPVRRDDTRQKLKSLFDENMTGHICVVLYDRTRFEKISLTSDVDTMSETFDEAKQFYIDKYDVPVFIYEKGKVQFLEFLYLGFSDITERLKAKYRDRFIETKSFFETTFDFHYDNISVSRVKSELELKSPKITEHSTDLAKKCTVLDVYIARSRNLIWDNQSDKILDNLLEQYKSFMQRLELQNIAEPYVDVKNKVGDMFESLCKQKFDKEDTRFNGGGANDYQVFCNQTEINIKFRAYLHEFLTETVKEWLKSHITNTLVWLEPHIQLKNGRLQK
jgi:hypothetical protein